MDNVLNTMQEKERELIKLREQIEKKLKEMPEGSLRITHKRGKAAYYWIRPGEKQKYLNQDMQELKQLLAQKSYLKSLFKEATKQLDAIQEFLKSYSTLNLTNIFQLQIPERKKLITPLVLSDDEFARQWQEEKYEGKKFAESDKEIYTERGEIVRSKSEKIIADKFYFMGIPYKYECPLKIPGFGTVHPDFTVLNKKKRKVYYWEHLGMMDDMEYSEHALKKIEAYTRGNILPGEKLILTHETSGRPLDVRSVEQYIHTFIL